MKLFRNMSLASCNKRLGRVPLCGRHLVIQPSGSQHQREFPISRILNASDQSAPNHPIQNRVLRIRHTTDKQLSESEDIRA